MLMPNIDSCLMDVGLKGPLGLDYLFRGQYLLYLYIANITIVIYEDCCCEVDQIHISEVDPWIQTPLSADIGTFTVPLSN